MINISIDNKLKDTYSEIRLGCIHFSVEVKPSSDEFWIHMNTDVLPKEKNGVIFPEFVAAGQHTKLLEEIPEDTECHLNRF